VNRLVPPGEALAAAVTLAQELAAFPQRCLRADRASLLSGWSQPLEAAMRQEFEGGLDVVRSGETAQGAQRFADGAGRHGEPA
jgi:enoyl-CoA hydratase